MPSQKKLKLSTVLMAPAQTQADGTLLVLAETSSTIPPITDKSECWVAAKMDWDSQIKKKWSGFDPSMFQNAKTFTTNRPYTKNYKDDKSWSNNINKSLNYNFTNNPASARDQGFNSPDMMHKNNISEIKAIDQIFGDYGNHHLAPYSPKSAPSNSFRNYYTQKFKDNSEFNLGI